MPLISIPILTSGLGLETYGVFASLIAKSLLFVVIMELGFEMYIGKEVSICRNDPEKIVRLLWAFLLTKGVSCLLASLFLYWTATSFGSIETALVALVISQSLNATAFISGLEEYGFLAVVQFWSKAVLLMILLLLDLSESGLEKALIAHAFVAGFATIWGYLFLSRLVNIRWDWPSTEFVVSILRASLPFYGARLFVNMYQQSSTYFTSFFLAAELVAIYSIGMQIYRVGQSVIGAVARVLYTSTVSTKDFGFLRQATFYSLIVYAVGAVFVLVFGESILATIFAFDVGELTQISFLFYASLLSILISSYWGYPALTAIGKENFAHIGIMVSSLAYILSVFAAAPISLLGFVSCVIFADFCGMLVRIFFVIHFRLLELK